MLRRRNARLDTILRGAAFAKVEQFDLAALYARELHDGVPLSAAIAQHQASTSRTPVSLSRPSSSSSARSARRANDRLCVTTTIAISKSRDSSTNRSWSRALFAWSRLPDG